MRQFLSPRHVRSHGTLVALLISMGWITGILLIILALLLLMAAKNVAKARQMKQTAQLLQEFAHDIRSPVNALCLMVEQLENVPIEQWRIIEMATKNIHQMTSQLLCKQPFPRTPEVLSHWLHCAYQTKLAEARAKGVHFCLLIDSNARTQQVTVDPMRLQTVFLNLIDNSLDACEPGDAIRLELYCSHKKAHVTITDTGCGIPAAHLAAIGTGKSLTTKNSGHGIGIASARHALAQWRGSLHFESEMGKGTTARIEIPLSSGSGL